MTEAVTYASFAPEDLKEGGGNLWGSNAPVRATIRGGRFTMEAPDGYNASGSPIFAVIDFTLAVPKTADQTDAEYAEMTRVNQSYSLGAQAGENFTISEDGQRLVKMHDDASIVRDSKFGIFCLQCVNEKVPASTFKDFSFEKLVGLDGDFKRIADKARAFPDEEGRGQRKSKYPPSTLVLVKLHSFGKVSADSTASATTKAVSGPTHTGNGAVTPIPSSPEELDGVAWDYLSRALTNAPNRTLPKSRVVLAVSKVVNEDGPNPQRQAIASRAANEGYLASLVEAGLIAFQSSEKGPAVALAG